MISELKLGSNKKYSNTYHKIQLEIGYILQFFETFGPLYLTVLLKIV